jgi:uncharacterized protein (TIGR03663 family)
VKSTSISSDSVPRSTAVTLDPSPTPALEDPSLGPSVVPSGTPSWIRLLNAQERVAWIAACAAIILAGAILRLYNLELVPLHHDEGVNGFFLTGLYRNHLYHYNPENYHGPSLYFFGLISSYLFGLNTFAIRLTTALFGIATIWLILMLRKRIGTAGSLAAAAFVAFSPAAIYFSRYFIHETLFVFFMLGIVAWGLRYKDTRRTGSLLAAAAMAGLMVATKETAIVNALVLAVAAILAGPYVLLRQRGMVRPSQAAEGEAGAEPESSESSVGQKETPFTRPWVGAGAVLAGLVKDRRDRLAWGAAAAIFLAVAVLMYSSLFTHPRGLVDAVKAFTFWSRTGRNTQLHPWSQYLRWMWQQEPTLLVLGGLGVAACLWLGRNRFAVFAALAALGLIAGYSLIPYKTPWLVLNMMVPMAIAAGCGINALYLQANRLEKFLCVALIIAPIGLALRQGLDLNFTHYDDPQYGYVYVHTQRELVDMVDEVKALALRSGQGPNLTITIAAPEYWPLPWYFRNYHNITYTGMVANRGDSVVIVSEEQDPEAVRVLGDSYVEAGTYHERPGITLILYIKQGLERPPKR